MAATLAGAISMFARLEFWFGGRDDRDRGGGLLTLILVPIAAMLIQLAVSRSREYQADESGAHFTGNPSALARALQKIDAYSQSRWQFARVGQRLGGSEAIVAAPPHLAP